MEHPPVGMISVNHRNGKIMNMDNAVEKVCHFVSSFLVYAVFWADKSMEV